MMCSPDRVRDDLTMTKLWIHEVSRVFHDRLINEKDRNWFYDKIIELLGRFFKAKLEKDAIFVK
jgi:dynein heavy chain, axonemal